MNPPHDHAAALRELGLDGLDLETVALVSLPVPGAAEVAKGLQAAAYDVAGVLAAALDDPRPSPYPTSLPRPWLHAFRDARHESVVVFDADDGLRLASSGRALPGILEREGTIAFDLRVFRGQAVARPGGRAAAVILRLGPGTTSELELELKEAGDPDAPRPLPAPDLAPWIGDDAWLAASVAARLRAGTPIEVAQAVGEVWRLRRRRPEAVREHLAALLAGRPVAALDPPRAWAGGLSAEDRDQLERRGLVAVELLETQLDDALDEADVDDPSWQRRLLGLCHRRDALEGLVLVLQGAGGGAALTTALAELDDRGQAVFGGLRDWPAPADDERLRRAAELDPDAWWTTPVRAEE